MEVLGSQVKSSCNKFEANMSRVKPDIPELPILLLGNIPPL